MTDFRILNGNRKATLIETFDGKAKLFPPGWSMQFATLEQAKKFVHDSEIEINISMIHGSQVQREVLAHGNSVPTNNKTA